MKKLFFSILVILIALIFSEFLLLLFCYFSPKLDFVLQQDPPVRIPDSKLEYRLNPADPQNDINGYRNASVPQIISVLALGDSQTYGWRVRREDAWPQQLGRLSLLDTYNMGVGGYGPIHSLLQLSEALALKPKVVIEAVFFGNDFYDSYKMVYKKNKFPDLKSPDASLKKLTGLDSINPISTPGSFGSVQTPEAPDFNLKSWIGRNSRIYGLIRSFIRKTGLNIYKEKPDITWGSDWEVLQNLARINSNRYWAFSGSKAKTIFDLENKGMAQKDPRIEEGFRITLEVLRKMNNECKSQNVKFLVVFLPTKFIVFKNLIQEEAKEIPPAYHLIVNDEEQFERRAEEFLKRENIEYIRPLPNLRELFLKADQPYFISANVHYSPSGQRTIAEAIARKLRAQDSQVASSE